MEHEPRTTSVSPSEKTIPIDRDRTLVAPRFDDKSVQRARPAVPLTRGAAKRLWPPAFLVACVVAGLVGGVVGGLGLMLYQKKSVNESPAPLSSSAPAPVAPAPAAADERAPAATVAESVRVETPAAPSADVARTPAGDASADEGREGRSATEGKMKASPQQPPKNEGEVSRAADGEEQATLRGALDEWVSATNARDIQRQMDFYGQTVSAFYLTRNVPREAVRAEKSRVFGSADAIDIRAGAPDIRLSRDGLSATMRFRKKYSIEGGGRERRGEVVQELRWRRTEKGWKIVGERDVRVIQ